MRNKRKNWNISSRKEACGLCMTFLSSTTLTWPTLTWWGAWPGGFSGKRTRQTPRSLSVRFFPIQEWDRKIDWWWWFSDGVKIKKNIFISTTTSAIQYYNTIVQWHTILQYNCTVKDDLMWLKIETDLRWVVVGVEGENRDSLALVNMIYWSTLPWWERGAVGRRRAVL